MEFIRKRVLWVMAAASIGLAVGGYHEMKIRSVAKVEPQTISCADLERKGPGDNAHVIVTDFLMCDLAYVYEKTDMGVWRRAWVPVVPLNGEYHESLLAIENPDETDIPLPKNIRIVADLPDVRSEGDIERMAQQETLQGTIVNVIRSLDAETESILRSSYPGVDFGNVLVLEVGKKPSGPRRMCGFFVGSIACLVIGVGLFIYWRRGPR